MVTPPLRKAPPSNQTYLDLSIQSFQLAVSADPKVDANWRGIDTLVIGDIQPSLWHVLLQTTTL